MSLQPAIIEITEVIEQADNSEMALYGALAVIIGKALTYYGKKIPNDEPGLLGAVGKLLRFITLYTPNRTKRDDK